MAQNKRSDIVVGLGFGDEGKGTTVDYLASQRKTEYVIRFSGGPQTAHNVVTPDGRQHTFAQFGSATFHHVKTILTRFMLVNPFNLAVEADALWEQIGYDPFDLLFVSENALLVTPLHVAANRAREIARGANRHGSCGQGIGETQSYALRTDQAPRISDLKNLNTLKTKLEKYLIYIEGEIGSITYLTPPIEEIIASYDALLTDRKLDIVTDEDISRLMRQGYNIFEGSQGVLLDENLGFHPHTTWSTTTAANAKLLALEAGIETPQVIGVTRSYTTRHGAGPFPSEFENSDWTNAYPELHNKFGKFEGAWRGGLLDLILLEYGVRANGGIDKLSLTHLDYPYIKAVTNYDALTEGIPTDLFSCDRGKQEQLTTLLNSEEFKKSASIVDIKDEESLINLIEVFIGKHPIIKSYGPTWKDKTE